jgi:hypothetical protein
MYIYGGGGGLDNVVGTGTRYELDGPGIESRWEARFSSDAQTGRGAHTASYTLGTGSSPGVKRPGRGIDHSPPLAPSLKKSRSITLLPLLAFVACSRVKFTFTLYIYIYIYIYTHR